MAPTGRTLLIVDDEENVLSALQRTLRRENYTLLSASEPAEGFAILHAEASTAMEAINEGEIYRFLTKPWEDADLKVALHLAFDKVALERSNRQLQAAVHHQRALLARLEQQHPGLRRLLRDESGAVLVDKDEEALLAVG
jgi:DNA-binding NtrC family response regulator